MEAKEFRIGNAYRWYADGKYYYYIVKEKDFASGYLRNFEPITLTEGMLLKCGFERALNQYKKTTKTKPFIIIFLENQFQYDDLRYRTNLKYIHQLQNLYFALTGEELEIDLQPCQ